MIGSRPEHYSFSGMIYIICCPIFRPRQEGIAVNECSAQHSGTLAIQGSGENSVSGPTPDQELDNPGKTICTRGTPVCLNRFEGGGVFGKSDPIYHANMQGKVASSPHQNTCLSLRCTCPVVHSSPFNGPVFFEPEFARQKDFKESEGCFSLLSKQQYFVGPKSTNKWHLRMGVPWALAILKIGDLLCCSPIRF